MDREGDMIRQQMDQTRESLAEKIATLENKVVGTVQHTTDAINETVETVKEQVQGTVETLTTTVKDSVQGTVDALTDTVNTTVESVTTSVSDTVDSVKQTLDVRQHVRDYPWASVGVAVAAGFAVAGLIGGPRRSSRRASRPSYTPSPQYLPSAPPPEPSRLQPLVDKVKQVEWPEPVKQAANTVRDLAMKAVGDLTKALIAGAVVGPLQQTLTHAVETFTQQINPTGATVTGDKGANGTAAGDRGRVPNGFAHHT